MVTIGAAAGRQRGEARRRARCLVVEVLYEWDIAHHDPWVSLERVLPQESQVEADYARKLLRDIVEHKEQFDRLIQRYAPAWPLDQMAAIDRNVLRLAFSELFFSDDVPPKVAVNEAVEIARDYAGEPSSRFVNGVLGKHLAQAPHKK